MTVQEALEGVSLLLLDTAPVIYHLERHPRYGQLMASVLAVRAERRIQMVISPVTLAECLVHPFRLNRTDLVELYTTTLLTGEDISFHALDAQPARQAARVRAVHGLSLHDAIQVAVARQAGCEAILTNDADFKRVSDPRPVILHELAGDQAT